MSVGAQGGVTEPTDRTLLERDTELGAIARVLDAARLSRGSALLLEGPPGIGKTALLQAATGMAEAQGMQIFLARGSELERDFTYGVVRQLFERPLVGASDAARASLLAGAARFAASAIGNQGDALEALPRGPHGLDSTFATVHGLYWLCANFAERGAMVLALDDVHWCDSPSLRFLIYLLGRIEELPIALLLATRPAEPASQQTLLADLASAPPVEVLRPSALTEPAVARLVEGRLAGVPEPEFVHACRAATGGNPFLLQQLIGALAADGVDTGGRRAGRRRGAPERGRACRLGRRCGQLRHRRSRRRLHLRRTSPARFRSPPCSRGDLRRHSSR
jgi:predicted ATPase